MAPPIAVAAPEGPLLVVVSIGSQRLAVYDKHGRVLESAISSGQVGYDTPQGVFSIIERNREHFSNLYDDAPMPNMQRITWSGVAMHAGRLPGYPASHGCIRLPLSVSERLFELTRLGTRVVVTEDDVAPVAFEHSKLFNTRSEDATLKVADAGGPMRSNSVIAAPMLLGGAITGLEPTPGLPPSVDPFAGRPEGLSRAAWTAELLARSQVVDAKAKAAKVKAAASVRDASGLMTVVLKAERSRSVLAARVDALEARLANATSRPKLAAKIEKERDATLARLGAVMADIDRLRAMEEAKRGEADRSASEAQQLEEKRGAAALLAREASRGLKPVSVFVSRKTGRLYVRQGFHPLFDVPVGIEHASQPIGTHVFTAIGQKQGSEAMQWSAITTVGATPEVTVQPAARRARKGMPTIAPEPRPHLTATAALDRIEIPDDVRQRIAQMLMPGSSLIVSDEGISVETGKGTDFVVLTQ
ncbi:MAG: L,D-transpeptidase family protein [Hyphomicrobiaceae bacterium]